MNLEHRVTLLEAALKNASLYGPDNLPPGIAFSSTFTCSHRHTSVLQVNPWEPFYLEWLAFWKPAHAAPVTVRDIRAGTRCAWGGRLPLVHNGALIRLGYGYLISPAVGVSLYVDHDEPSSFICTVGGAPHSPIPELYT